MGNCVTREAGPTNDARHLHERRQCRCLARTGRARQRHDPEAIRYGQDFDDTLGNLLDNACKWARSRVTVSVTADHGRVAIAIDDDGPGLDATAIPEAMRPRRRIDEATPGHGFGLPIAAELAELYGGSIDLSQATNGGLRVTVTLPQAI